MSDFLTPAEVAAELRLSESAVYRALLEHRLPGTKPLGRWRIDRAELEDWLREQRPVPKTREPADPMPNPQRDGGLMGRVIEIRRRRAA